MIDTTHTHDIVKQIKQSFRLYMNGTTSRSMREKGIEYKINWGVSQVDLRSMASQYTPDVALAQELWHEDIRECKILATYIMPAEQMPIEMARQWVMSIKSIELAEVLVFNLFRHLPYADTLVKEWLISDGMRRMCAYHLLCRLIKQDKKIATDVYELLWRVAKNDADTTDIPLRHALFNILSYIASSSSYYASQAASLLTLSGFNAF